ncbi:MAG: hypothetical protein ACRCYR_03775 [Phycicoccus sp.]
MTAAPSTARLTVPQGVEWGIRWPITPPPTGGTVKAQVRRTRSSDAVLHEWSTGAGNATVSEQGVTLLVPAVVSSGWDWRTGVFDVEYTDPDGAVHRIAQGVVEVDREVTR